MCILKQILSAAHANGRMGVEGGGLKDLKLGTFIGRFPSDGAASKAVKGLNNLVFFSFLFFFLLVLKYSLALWFAGC